MFRLKLRIRRKQNFIGSAFKSGSIKWRIVKYDEEEDRYFRSKEVHLEDIIDNDKVYEGNSYAHEMIVLQIQINGWIPINE